MKRTTGIPRSFLKTIEKPIALANDGTVDDTKQPSGVMVNADGEWVVAEPDKASWDQYQAKAKISAAAQEIAARGSRELQERGLECSIDKRLFVEPTKTPCCQATYCLECITDALLENDLQCPACSTNDILIDDLIPDTAKAADIRKYEDEENTAGSLEVNSKSPKKQISQSASQKPFLPLNRETSRPAGDKSSTKRPAEAELTNNRTPFKTGALDIQPTNSNGMNVQPPKQAGKTALKLSSSNQLPFPGGNFMFPQGMNSLSFPMANGFMGTPVSMASGMNTNSGMFDPTIMQNPSMMGISNGSWNGTWGAGFPQSTTSLNGGGLSEGLMPNGFNRQQNMQIPTTYGYIRNGMRPNGQSTGSFVNQQRNAFSAAMQNEEDSAYFRKPVNPHRHQARRNVNRPTDYREI